MLRCVYVLTVTLLQWLLKVVLYPGIFSLAIFYVLYSIAEYKFSDWYFAVGYVWKPAFPLSWRIVFLFLFIVPMLAFIQLFWLFFFRLGFPYRWWRQQFSSPSNSSPGYVMLSRSESNSLEEALSGAADNRDSHLENIQWHAPPFKQHRFSLAWSLRFIFWFGVLCISLSVVLHYQHPGDQRYLPLIKNANAHPRREGYHGNKGNATAKDLLTITNQPAEKIFIAVMFSNNERVIPYWSDSIVKAIHYLGEDNVFVSILESGSGDRSPALLRQLDDRLDAMRVSRRILTEDTAIVKPDDMSGNNRIDFLSALRNRVLEPLVENGGYDKVVFSNDVYIEPESIVELLKTADGEYDMACGMDFGHFGLYDLWVIRDKQGRLPSSIWPYFFDQEGYEAMQDEAPVPVFTCWNGIVVFTADSVLPIYLRSNNTLSNDPLPFELPATHPAANDASLQGPSPALTPPIGFRASAPHECFSSESFLLPYDFRRLFNLQRILVNPRVVVGYDWRFYVYFKWFMRHPVLTWWIEKVYDGAWMQKDIMVVGDAKGIWQWDGGDCHPWW